MPVLLVIFEAFLFGVNILNTVAPLAAGAGNNNIQVVFKNCDPFTNCRSKISNIQIDNAKCNDVIMPMYDLIEYSDNYLKTSGSLW